MDSIRNMTISVQAVVRSIRRTIFCMSIGMSIGMTICVVPSGPHPLNSGLHGQRCWSQS